MALSDTYKDVWAVPGKQSIIDVVNVTTGLTAVYGHDAAAVLAREPLAVRMSWEAWQAAAAARQHTPITWEPTTAEQYHEMLNVLPPACWIGGAFLVGEPADHDFETGRARFSAYWQRSERTYVTASRPVTVAEFKREVAA